MTMSSTRRAATVLLTTAALTLVVPTTGAAWAAQAPTDRSICTQTENNLGSSTLGSSSTGGGVALDPQVLQQAQDLVDQTRALLASLIASEDHRAEALVEQLRGMGITPAVAAGWRQRAHDLADSLLIAKAPAARRAAVILARAGFSPTPADLRDARPEAAVKREQTPSSAPSEPERNAAPAAGSGSAAAPAAAVTPAGAARAALSLRRRGRSPGNRNG